MTESSAATVDTSNVEVRSDRFDPARIVNGLERPPAPGPVSVSLTFAWRALLKFKHVPEQLFDVTMFPIMFTLMFTYLFGGALAGSTDAYLQFLLPGILVQTVLMISMYTGMGVAQDIQKGVFDRFRSLPIWQPSPLVGMLVADLFRYVTASLVIVVLGLVLGFDLGEGGVAGMATAIGLVVLFSVSLSWIWTAFGVIARSYETVMYLSMFILFPLTFISNVFVDPATMPSALEAFVGVNPVSHVTDASRGLVYGSASIGDISLVIIESAVLTAVFAPIAVALYRRKGT